MDYRPGGGWGGGEKRERDALGPPPGAFWEVIKGEPLRPTVTATKNVTLRTSNNTLMRN